MSLIKPNPTPNLYDILDQLKEKIFRTLCCMRIGIIQNYDPTIQQATILIASKAKNPFNDTLCEYPPLENVPVIDLGGKSYLHLPINEGDECLVFFSDLPIDEWYNTGQAQPPQLERKHDLSDAIALVGIRSTPNLIQGLENVLNLYYSENSNIILNNEGMSVTAPAITMSGDLTVDKSITGNTTVTSELHSVNGANGSFVTEDKKTVTVVDGIITSIA